MFVHKDRRKLAQTPRATLHCHKPSGAPTRQLVPSVVARRNVQPHQPAVLSAHQAGGAVASTACLRASRPAAGLLTVYLVVGVGDATGVLDLPGRTTNGWTPL